MFSTRSKLALPALAFVLLAGCQVRFGPTEAGTAPGGGDPAEQAAIQTVKSHGGGVRQDEGQPDKPVLEVNLSKETVTDEKLKGAGPAETPKVTTMTTLVEERSGLVGEKDSARASGRLYASFRIEGAKNVRSHGNLNVTEAKTDTGADLLRRPKDPKAGSGITNVPGFLAVSDYQAKSGMVDVRIELFGAPRAAKKLKLKGTIEVLVGGEPADIDIPDVLAKGDKEVLKHEAFTAAGLKIILSRSRFGKDERSVAYTIEGNDSTLKEVTLVDASGKVIPASRGSAGFRGPGQTHYVTSSVKLPKDAKLRVTIYKGGKTSKLPFEFDNIELP